MNREVLDRVLTVSNFISSNECTIRQAAKVFNVSKSTIHLDVSKRLKKVNYPQYLRVKNILEKNFFEKHLRGGQATKNKYKKIAKNAIN